jgi:hypothetical protein
LRFLIRFDIDRQPPPVNGSIPEEKESRKKNQRGRRPYAEFLGRKCRGWNNTFRQPSLVQFYVSGEKKKIPRG